MAQVQVTGLHVLPDQPKRYRLGDRAADLDILAELRNLVVHFEMLVTVGASETLQWLYCVRWEDAGQAHPAFALQVLEVFGR